MNFLYNMCVLSKFDPSSTESLQTPFGKAFDV